MRVHSATIQRKRQIEQPLRWRLARTRNLREARTMTDGSLSAMALLREATRSCHQRLERRLDIGTRFSNRSAYQAHLERMWGFCIAVERQLDAVAFDRALADYPVRRKSPWLEADLMALGASAAEVQALSVCPGLSACVAQTQREALPAAFGLAYVLEGASMGGRVLLPMVERALGLTAMRGARFLASYGEEVVARWESFGAALNRCCDSPADRRLCEAAAVLAFVTLESWLCGEVR